MHSSHSCPLSNRKTIQLGKHLNLEKKCIVIKPENHPAWKTSELGKKCIVIKLENHPGWKTFESGKKCLAESGKKREKFSLKNI